MNKPKLKIHSIETLGTHEGPGIRYVIFVQGCNWKCAYCHNPDTQSLKGGQEITVQELVERILKNKAYFGDTGGVTISGGEPLLQAEAINQLFVELKKKGIKTCIDTNGSILNRSIQELLDNTDLVLLDIKHFDEEKHKKLTGSSNSKTVNFLNYLEEKHIPFWVRYVLVPEVTNQEESLEELASYLKQFNSLQRIEILPYHTLGVHKYREMNLNYSLDSVEPPSEKDLERAEKIFKKSDKHIVIR